MQDLGTYEVLDRILPACFRYAWRQRVKLSVAYVEAAYRAES